MDTVTCYQLCAVIDLSFLKVKNPSVESMSMLPALHDTPIIEVEVCLDVE